MRGICVGYMEHDEPTIFAQRTRDGLPFRASERWVAKLVAKEVQYVKRMATRAAQKVPRDFEEKLRYSFLREARAIRDYSIPAELRVNIDQTQNLLQDNGKCTYDPLGAKQVAVFGVDEKRAFTTLVGVSASGALLPFQIIYKGQSKLS
ncbi:hypothetical protein EXIGLDRAFT_686158, partial [Exidia glandulosa HHB12029]